MAIAEAERTIQGIHHHDLRQLLADHLRLGGPANARFVAQEVNCGSRWFEPGCPRMDVLTVAGSHTRPMLTAYEVKASRADFLSDIRADKWRAYLPFCHRLYFACPRGVLARDEIPDGMGLLTYNAQKRTWTSLKTATVQNAEPATDYSFLLGVLFAAMNEEQRQREGIGRFATPEAAQRWKEHKARSKVRGDELRAQLAGAKEREWRAQHEHTRVTDLVAGVCDALGIDVGELKPGHAWNARGQARHYVEQLIAQVRAEGGDTDVH